MVMAFIILEARNYSTLPMRRCSWSTSVAMRVQVLKSISFVLTLFSSAPIKPLKKRLRIEELLDVRSKTKALGQSRGSTHFSAAEVMKLPRMATKLNAETKRSVEKTNKETLLSDPWKTTSTSFKPPRLQAPVISRTIRAAEICHPGTSYNPTAKDHSDAIQIATKIELVKLKRIESDLLAGNKRVLMSTQGLDADMSMEVADDQSEDDVELSLVSDEATLKNLRKIKKTRLQRNKAARHKLLLAAASALRERRKYLAQLDEVDEVARALDEKLSKRKLELEMRKRQLAVRETTVTARLSRHPFIAPPMAIQLTEELSESLRALQVRVLIF